MVLTCGFYSLQSLNMVDLNARTLDGRLAEEMCEDKNITSLVHRARTHEPKRCVKITETKYKICLEIH